MKHSDFVHLHVHTQYSLLDGMIRLEDLFQKAKVKKLIPKIWQQLLSEPDDLLCDLLIEAVEAEGGHSPIRDDVVSFLQSSHSSNDSIKNFQEVTPHKQSITSGLQPCLKTTKNSIAQGKGIGFRVSSEAWQTFQNGKQCYVAIIRHLVSKYPEFPDRFQNAKTRGKRAWISKSKEDLFPGRPDFQESEVTEVGAGWLVGTQMSAQVEMPKRIEAACACVGLVFSRDIEAVFL